VAPGEGALRLTRTAVFAVSAVGLASAAHLASDGDVPRPLALLGVPVVMLVVHLLAAGRRGPIGLFFGMGLTQIGLHLLFMSASITGTCGSTVQTASAGSAGSMVGMAMPGQHGHLAACGTGHAAGELLPSSPMLLAHLLATLVLVAVLSRGEAAVWALAACLRFRFALPRVTVLLPAVRRLPIATRARLHPTPTAHLRSIRRRGPPALIGVPV
jgi:hypothetical protein